MGRFGDVVGDEVVGGEGGEWGVDEGWAAFE